MIEPAISLQPIGAAALAVMLVTACVAFWLTNLLTLPGNWLMVAAIALYAVAGPSRGNLGISVGTAAAAFAVALAGEAVEFFAAAAGARRAGASRRSTFFAIVGSMAGALLGMFVGIPILIVGPLVAAVLFGGLGATAGGFYGQWTDGESWRDSLRVGHAAFWGRTLGTIGKTSLGIIIVGIAFAAVLF